MAWMEDVKVGKKILIDWMPYEVLKAEHLKVAMWKWMEKTTLLNLMTGNTMTKTFREVDKVEVANISHSNAEYLYKDDDGYNFMNTDTFEQAYLNETVIWDKKFFLSEWDKVILIEFEWKPLSIEVEPSVTLEVMDTPPWERWDTATWWKKPAILSTWLKVQVPLFVKNWDKIKVDTRTYEYLSRA